MIYIERHNQGNYKEASYDDVELYKFEVLAIVRKIIEYESKMEDMTRSADLFMSDQKEHKYWIDVYSRYRIGIIGVNIPHEAFFVSEEMIKKAFNRANA
jgi:hypothetical protein